MEADLNVKIARSLHICKAAFSQVVRHMTCFSYIFRAAFLQLMTQLKRILDEYSPTGPGNALLYNPLHGQCNVVAQTFNNYYAYISTDIEDLATFYCSVFPPFHQRHATASNQAAAIANAPVAPVAPAPGGPAPAPGGPNQQAQNAAAAQQAAAAAQHNAVNHLQQTTPQGRINNTTNFRVIGKTLKRDFDITCSNDVPNKCKVPTASTQPDVVVYTVYDHVNGQLPPLPGQVLGQQQQPYQSGAQIHVPGIVIEVIGGKDLWGKFSEMYKGVLGALGSLPSLERAYLLQVRTVGATLYCLERDPASNKIEVSGEEFPFSGPQGFAEALKQMSRQLMRALIDVLIRQDGIAHANSQRLMGDGWTHEATRPLTKAQRGNIHFYDANNQYPHQEICCHIRDTGNVTQRRLGDIRPAPY